MSSPDDAIQHFGCDGWAVFRQVFTPCEVHILAASIANLTADPRSSAHVMSYYAPNKPEQLVRIERFVEADPLLASLLTSPRICDIVFQTLGATGELFKDKVNIRHPGSPGFPAHQDVAAGWLDFAPRFVSLSVVLHKSMPDRGGLQLVSGKHTQGLMQHDRGALLEDVVAGLHFVSPTLEAGDILVIDGFTPHQSCINNSDVPSTHLFLTFNPAGAGSHRTAYYRKKEQAFNRSGCNGGFSFRLFSFDDETTRGAGGGDATESRPGAFTPYGTDTTLDGAFT